MIGLGHGVDVVDVERLDHRAFAHVAEQAELAPLLLRDRAVGAAQQDVGLDADRPQLFHRVLGRLGLELTGAGDERQQREVDIDRVVAGKVVAELADRLEERQALDVADGAADLAEHEIVAVIALADEVLDGIGDVRDHLDGGAEIIAAPLLGENLLIDAAGGDVVLAGRRPPGEALVVAKVEVSLRTVIGDEHFAVLIGAHGPGIDIQIRIKLLEPY